MSYLIIALVAAAVSALTLYSGFGLGTLLLPAFALFFPLEVAVAATAVVHGANNALKLALVGRHASRQVVLRFGLPAILAAIIGAALLGLLAESQALYTYQLGKVTAEVTALKVVIGLLMLVFALLELLPRFRSLRFDSRHLTLGGILSGFFGGLSGHQGALRSAFLVKANLRTEEFVGTNAVIGFLVDLIRISVYLVSFWFIGRSNPLAQEHWPLILTGIGAAFAGLLLARKYLHAVTMTSIQTLTGVMLLLVGIALGAGLI